MDINWQRIWFEGKDWIENTILISRDLMHVHIGLFVFVFFAVLLRNRRYGLLLAWSVVFILQTFNEVMDARDWINWTGTVNWSETAKDHVMTLFWPTVLLLVWGRTRRTVSD